MKFDTIIIGSDIEALVCANLIANKGKRVLVLEKREKAGGLTSGYEFFKDFHSPGFYYNSLEVRPWVIDKLGLKEFGLNYKTSKPKKYIFDKKNNSGFWLDSKSIQNLIPNDAKGFEKFNQFISRLKPVFEEIFDSEPPQITSLNLGLAMDLFKTGLNIRKLGKEDMMELIRIAPQCVADFLNEFFQNESLKSALSYSAVESGFVAPWSPGTATNLILNEVFGSIDIDGGSEKLLAALLSLSEKNEIKFQFNEEVQEILIEDGKVTGIKTQNGILNSDHIISFLNPKQTLLKLIHPKYLPYQLSKEIEDFRSIAHVGQLNIALKGPVKINNLNEMPESFFIASTLNDMEKEFDFIKYNQNSKEFLIDGVISTINNPQLAPQGQHVLSLKLSYFNEENFNRDQVIQNIIKSLSPLIPDLADKVLATSLLTPKDIENKYGVHGGHLFMGELGLDQLLLRPSPLCSNYKTPITGLLISGLGTHPGGRFSGVSGYLASKI